MAIGKKESIPTSAEIISSLGYVPENVSNKATDFVTVNNTLYPSIQAAKTYIDGRVAGAVRLVGGYDPTITSLYPIVGSGTGGDVIKGDLYIISADGNVNGIPVIKGDSVLSLTDSPGQLNANWDILETNLTYVPENVSNKATDFTVANNTLYPSVLAAKNYADTKQPALGFTPENVANKATNFTISNNTLYPTVQASKTFTSSGIYIPTLGVGVLNPLSIPINFTSISGKTVAYTVPSNRKAIVIGAGTTNSSITTAITSTYYIRIGATDYLYSATTVNSPLNSYGNIQTVAAYFVLEAGESFVINHSAAGLTQWARIIEFDSETNLKSARLLSMNVGNNTLYTCPALKYSEVIGAQATLASTFFQYINDSGGARNITGNLVKSGDAVSTANQIIASASVNPGVKNMTLNAYLNAGDFLNINTDANTSIQWAYATVIERTF